MLFYHPAPFARQSRRLRLLSVLFLRHARWLMCAHLKTHCGKPLRAFIPVRHSLKASIIQDSLKDWETESITMDKVYRHSTLTIAACNSIDSFCSLFVERDPCTGAAMTFQQHFSDQEVEFTVLPNWPEFTRDYAPLYRRGWVVQEKYLSSRIIHFTRFPFWECGTTVVTEAYPDRTGSNNLGFTSLPSTERDWISTIKTSENLDWNWNKVLSQYTGCSLTHDSDILVAISGLAKCLSNVIKEDYFAGIWGGNYVICLLWRKVPTRMSNQPKVHNTSSYRGL
jgi:hypothetical protein